MKIACFNLFFLLAFGLVPCQSRIRRVLLPVPRLLPIVSPYSQQEEIILLVNEARSRSSPFFPFFGGPMSSMAETGTMAVAAITLVAVASMVNTASLTTTATSTTMAPVITTSVPIETTTTPVADPCTPNPCLNGGVCQLIGTTFMCNCRGGFTGITCNIPSGK